MSDGTGPQFFVLEETAFGAIEKVSVFDPTLGHSCMAANIVIFTVNSRFHVYFRHLSSLTEL